MKLILFVVFPMLVACGSSQKHDVSAVGYAEQSYSESDATSDISSESSSTRFVNSASIKDRQIIKTGFQEVEVENIEQASQNIVDSVKNLGGFVEHSNKDSQNRAHFELRIPSEKLDAAMLAIGSQGKELEKRVVTKDVTEESIDLEARRKNSIALRDKLQEFLKMAKTMKEATEIQREITYIQTEIDRLEARISMMKKQVAYSDLQVDLKKGRTMGPIGWIGYGLYWGVSKLVFWE